MPNNDEDIEVKDESTDEVVPYIYSITSYGADYPVDSLVKRLEKDVIFIPSFQRSYVWKLPQASRFIESLLLGLPVPGIFLSREADSGKLLVIDGHQRLKTLLFFYEGIFEGREFRLTNVQERFEGKTYKTLEEDDRLRLDDSIIHATIVRQDEPSDDVSSIYSIFERLNTGGTLLQPQEIRACIYHGSFNDLLNELNNYPAWREIFGQVSKRLKDQELILRFFALNFDLDNYKRPMKEFLNEYMGKNKELKLQGRNELEKGFYSVIDLISGSLGKKAFRLEGPINAAVFDAVMVGLLRRLSRGPIKEIDRFLRAYDELLKNPDFYDACKTATSDLSNVYVRIELSTNYFMDLV